MSCRRVLVISVQQMHTSYEYNDDTGIILILIDSHCSDNFDSNIKWLAVVSASRILAWTYLKYWTFCSTMDYVFGVLVLGTFNMTFTTARVQRRRRYINASLSSHSWMKRFCKIDISKQLSRNTGILENVRSSMLHVETNAKLMKNWKWRFVLKKPPVVVELV